MSRSRAAMVSSAWSHEIRSNLPWPFAPTRFWGYRSRPGEYSRSRYRATLPHRNPRVTGWSGFPRNRLPFLSSIPGPSAISISNEQQSGQSSAQTECRTCGMLSIITFARVAVTRAHRPTSVVIWLVLKGRLVGGFGDPAGGLWGYNRSEELQMRCLVPAVLLLSLTGLVYGQGQSHQ